MDELNRESFAFFRSWYDSAKRMKDRDRLSFYDAIIKFSLFGESSELTEKAEPIFIAIEPVLIKSRARALSGSIGGKSKRRAKDEQNDGKAEANGEQNGSYSKVEYSRVKENTPPNPLKGDGARGSSQENPGRRRKDPAAGKTAYGKFGNVLLSEEERGRLTPAEAGLIEELSCYIESTGKRYANHYATLMNWARRRAEEAEERQAKDGFVHNESFTDADLEAVVEVL